MRRCAPPQPDPLLLLCPGARTVRLLYALHLTSCPFYGFAIWNASKTHPFIFLPFIPHPMNSLLHSILHGALTHLGSPSLKLPSLLYQMCIVLPGFQHALQSALIFYTQSYVFTALSTYSQVSYFSEQGIRAYASESELFIKQCRLLFSDFLFPAWESAFKWVPQGWFLCVLNWRVCTLISSVLPDPVSL